jgi:holo-[acyl-carrier protein] synthase
MIIGIGSDLLDIRRLEKTLLRFGAKFEQRVFTTLEREKALRRETGTPRNNHISTLAKRFAAKEACAKALGTGFTQGVFHKDMGVINLPSGQPTLQLTGGAAARLHAITPAGMQAIIHLSLTDEYPLAQAFVMIEAKSIYSS